MEPYLKFQFPEKTHKGQTCFHGKIHSLRAFEGNSSLGLFLFITTRTHTGVLKSKKPNRIYVILQIGNVVSWLTTAEVVRIHSDCRLRSWAP